MQPTLLTESTVISRDSTAAIPLYIRFNCHRADELLTDANFVQSLIVKFSCPQHKDARSLNAQEL